MSKKLIQAAAGAGGESVYVEDVFSTYLYEGRSGASGLRTIDNGINLQDEGGLIWTRERDNAAEHLLIDTERGLSGGYLATDATSAANTSRVNESIDSFTTSGYKLDGGGTLWDRSTYKYCSWTFRKQAGFFDVVTYTGDGTAGRTVSHNLGSVPGLMIIKNTDFAEEWTVYHRSTGATKSLRLDNTEAAGTRTSRFNNTEPTATEFTVGTFESVNRSGDTIVAYLFAHDDQSFGDNSNESIIKCGSYTGNATAGNFVNLGWEPQYVLIKNANSASQWWIHDIMRGLVVGGVDNRIRPDTTDAENTFLDAFWIAPDGFYVRPTGTDYGKSGDTFIYIAIRRPMKTPEAGTDVFSAYGYQDTGLTSGSGTASNRTIINGGVNGGSGFPVDLFIHQWRDKAGAYAAHVFDRLRGKGKSLLTNSTSAEPAGDGATNSGFDFQEGVDVEYNGFAYYYTTAAGNRNHITYHLKRATGFLDVVAYTGTGNAFNLNHNLGVAPELAIIKERNAAEFWIVGSKSFSGASDGLYLNSNAAKQAIGSAWTGGFPTAATSSSLAISISGAINTSTNTYIAYLFATLAGVSKVGSYSGTGSNVDVDCGFSAGARFVLIKRTDSTGDWYYWDSVRGIIAGNDPYLLLNDVAVEVTSTDYIDPLSSGFTVTSSAPAALNTSGGTYIFLAIA